MAKERYRGTRRITQRIRGAVACRPDTRPPGRVGGEPMQIEFYRMIHWVAIAALVVWAVYSAYSAIIFS
jgi:hypothetical protein